MKEFQVCSNEGPRPFPRRDITTKHRKNCHWQILTEIKKSSLPEPIANFNLNLTQTIKADPAPAHPPFWNFQGFIFEKFDCITRIHFIVTNKQSLQSVFYLISTLTTKAQGMIEGASNQSPDLKNYTAPGPLPLLKNSWIRQGTFYSSNSYQGPTLYLFAFYTKRWILRSYFNPDHHGTITDFEVLFYWTFTLIRLIDWLIG